MHLLRILLLLLLPLLSSILRFQGAAATILRVPSLTWVLTWVLPWVLRRSLPRAVTTLEREMRRRHKDNELRSRLRRMFVERTVSIGDRWLGVSLQQLDDRKQHKEVVQWTDIASAVKFLPLAVLADAAPPAGALVHLTREDTSVVHATTTCACRPSPHSLCPYLYLLSRTVSHFSPHRSALTFATALLTLSYYPSPFFSPVSMYMRKRG
jgi:hypothetical protein